MYVIWANRYTDTSALKQNSYNTHHSQPSINYMSTVTCGCRCTSFILLTSHYTVFSAHWDTALYQLLQQNILNYTRQVQTLLEHVSMTGFSK